MKKTKKRKQRTADVVAVLCRFSKGELEYMQSNTLARGKATAVSIFCRRHIASEKVQQVQ